MKTSVYSIVIIVLVSITANLVLLINQNLIGTYFKWVNGFTGLALVVIVTITWLSKKRLDSQKTDYVHRVFSKN